MESGIILAIFLKYAILNKKQKGVLPKTMDDGDSNPENPPLYHKLFEAKRRLHLRM